MKIVTTEVIEVRKFKYCCIDNLHIHAHFTILSCHAKGNSTFEKAIEQFGSKEKK